MRQVAISTELFSLIWASRQDGEENEDQILLRILREKSINSLAGGRETPKKQERENMNRTFGVSRHSSWWQVIEAALERLGGDGGLSDIYRSVRALCADIGKTMPPSLEAAIRGTLEDNSSDSERWKRVRDVFHMPKGKHAGYWALRKKK